MMAVRRSAHFVVRSVKDVAASSPVPAVPQSVDPTSVSGKAVEGKSQ